jgi:predicted ATPase/DNA-binding CsgD family transcriptional regulator
VAEVAGLLDQHRLVTVTGPGGVGKTRLAGEVARQVAGRFADGVWLVELASVAEPTQVPATVAAALGLQPAAGSPVTESLAAVLARLQLLLVLDNCEHLLAAAAGLCGTLLMAADDMRILTTSREPVGVAGEARFRLPPLTLPSTGDPARILDSEAVTLFADRARQADPHFQLSPDADSAIARLVNGLDGMPLAIELAAARVEALGLTLLADRLNDRFRLLASTDRLVAGRHRSLTATADWSYQLLSEQERQVFRRLAVFPGPFTLEAAEAVAGPDAGPTVLHLVNCSLLTPPRTGPDGRARYLMLETLRGYAAERLAETEEQAAATASMTAYALEVARQAAAGLDTSTGEVAASTWLDNEDATLHQALAWVTEHDLDAAPRLAVALAPWWHLRGRSLAGYALLAAAARKLAPAGEIWCAAQYWLGQLALRTGNFTGALGHFTAVHDATAARGPSSALANSLAGRSGALRNLGRVPEAAADARHALLLARDIGYSTGEALALVNLGLAAYYARDLHGTLAWARQARRISPATIPGWIARWCSNLLTMALTEVGELDSARRSCAEELARARQAGDLHSQAICLDHMTELDRQAGHLADAQAHLHEGLEIASRIGNLLDVFNCLDQCGHLCAAAGRWADAVTIWAARAARQQDNGLFEPPVMEQLRQGPLQTAARALGHSRKQAAEERGTVMTLAAAAEFVAMLTAPDAQPPTGLARLSPREQELVTLVARGRTDSQIAGQLYITVRTVRSHLDRIRDKTGCRRRADLTRLALQAGLV